MNRFGNRKRPEKKKKHFGRAMLKLLILLTILILGTEHTQITVWKESFFPAEGTAVSQSLVCTNPELIPEYSGQDYIVLNGNMPMFTMEDRSCIKGEHYAPLDILGRCGPAYARIDASMRPTEERGMIGMIKPSGWNQARYEGYVASEPPYLYNRCHLIAYALTGQNANEQNLITGTRYFNTEAMLPLEEAVMKYLDYSENHVLYRVTPFFKGRELVARGVEMEALSLEDGGKGVCFHVFVYNRQPGIEINYLTGESRIASDAK